ncbi:MAG TPA: AAA family ATPase [Vicinamibacterales bacterium]|nr:AAA family ATPase [Vicinamibacterales bacterium]
MQNDMLRESEPFVRPRPLTTSPGSDDVPPELASACAAGECVLFAGPGFSIRAGYPDWKETLQYVIGYLTRRDRTLRLADLRAALADDHLRVVAELVLARAGRIRVVEALNECYSKRAMKFAQLPHQSLSRIPFSCVLTTGWDSLWKRVYGPRQPTFVHSTQRSAASHRLLRNDTFEIVRLYGTLEDADSVILTRDEYRSALQENKPLQQSLNSLVASKPVLFLGATLDVIEDFFASLQLGKAPRAHYALVPDEPDLHLRAEHLLYKYEVRLLPFDPGAEWTTVDAFLDVLAKAVHDLRGDHGARRTFESLPLQSVALENIGPFDQLRLDVNAGWNVILGNNGAGKSTILRAIALGLCGDDAEAAQAGRRLLKVGANTGSIELTIGNGVYRTELVREATGVRAICNQLTPLNAGYWVALGFPPLRGISEGDPRGPSPDGQSSPSVEDVLPLLTGSIDQRLSSLKQWIVNIDARTRPEPNSDETLPSRYVRLRDSLFNVLSKFTPGLELSFGSVDLFSWQVLVQTDDGLVPIDNVSQGMSSIFGWVGTLLQRLHEIYADAEEPEQQPALVLVDELDAHLHPEWQQLLVSIVKEVFPKLQVIATTHSPLLIAGLEERELWIARRRENAPGIEVGLAPLSPVGLRADQILTSPLFGLSHTRDQRLHERYDALLALKERTPEQQQEMEELRHNIGLMMSTGDTSLERAVQLAVREVIDDFQQSPADLFEFLTGGLSGDALRQVKTTVRAGGTISARDVVKRRDRRPRDTSGPAA